MPIANKIFSSAIGAVLLLGATSVSTTPAQARDGVALGLLGGLAAGALVGGALAQPRYYAPPRRAYVYPAYEPAYEPMYDECVARRVWGPYGWRWVHEC